MIHNDFVIHFSHRNPTFIFSGTNSSACYLAQSLPPTLDMISKYTQQSSGKACWSALLANANIGGENVHRGAVLGAILGAHAGDEELPFELKDGLFEKNAITQEINAFVDSILRRAPDQEL